MKEQATMNSELIGLDALIYDGNATRGIITGDVGECTEVLTDKGTYIASIVQFFDPGVLDKIIADKPDGINERDWLLFHMTLTRLIDKNGSETFVRAFRNGMTLDEYNQEYKIEAFIDDKLICKE